MNIIYHLFHRFSTLESLLESRIQVVPNDSRNSEPNSALHLLFYSPLRANMNQRQERRRIESTLFEYISKFRVLDSQHDNFPLIFELLTSLPNAVTHRGFLPTNNDATAATYVEIRHDIEINDNLRLSFVSFARTNTQPTKNLKFSTENVNSTSTTTSKVITSPVNHLIYVKHQHVLKISLQLEQTLLPCISS